MKEFYSIDLLIEFLRNNRDSVFTISGEGFNNSIYNLMYFNGKFAENKVFNLCANFTKYTIGIATFRRMFKACGSMQVKQMDFSDKRISDVFNYENFKKMKL